MLPIYYIAFVAQTEVAAKLENNGRERVSVVRMNPFSSVKHWATQTYQNVAKYVENVEDELQTWAYSQRACIPGSPVLAEC